MKKSISEIIRAAVDAQAWDILRDALARRRRAMERELKATKAAQRYLPRERKQ